MVQESTVCVWTFIGVWACVYMCARCWVTASPAMQLMLNPLCYLPSLSRMMWVSCSMIKPWDVSIGSVYFCLGEHPALSVSKWIGGRVCIRMDSPTLRLAQGALFMGYFLKLLQNEVMWSFFKWQNSLTCTSTGMCNGEDWRFKAWS